MASAQLTRMHKLPAWQPLPSERLGRPLRRCSSRAMAEWWWHTDRSSQIAALRAVIPRGGCLVLRGNDAAGRDVAARLLMHRLREFEYDVYAVSRAMRGASAKKL